MAELRRRLGRHSAISLKQRQDLHLERSWFLVRVVARRVRLCTVAFHRPRSGVLGPAVNAHGARRGDVDSAVHHLPQHRLDRYIIYRNVGWIDTHYPLIVPRILHSVFAIFLLWQFFKSIPQELEDAAEIDGASTFQIYWKIMLPQVKPALAAVGIFGFWTRGTTSSDRCFSSTRPGTRRCQSH